MSLSVGVPSVVEKVVKKVCLDLRVELAKISCQLSTSAFKASFSRQALIPLAGKYRLWRIPEKHVTPNIKVDADHNIMQYLFWKK